MHIHTFSLSVSMFSNWIITHINVQEVHQTKLLKSELLFIIIPETKISRMKYHENAKVTSHKFRSK